MLVSVDNSKVVIQNPSDILISDLKEILSFKDKSKDYQLKKMAANPYMRNSKIYNQLKAEASVCLLEQKDNQISFPTALLYLTNLQPDQDSRKLTGKTISLPWVSSSKAIQLRDYQREAVDIAVTEQRGIINYATSLGKTKTAIVLIKELKKKALFIAPNKSIALQVYEELCEVFGKSRIGFYGNGKKKLGDITVGIAQTVVNHTEDFKKHDLGVIIVDEAHRIGCSTFYSILDDLSGVGNIYALTATAYRSDGKDLLLNAACGRILIQYDAKWGIENGHLAKPVFIMRKIKTDAPDYSDKLMAYKSQILKAKDISSRIENDARKMMAGGKSTLILVDTIEHGEALEKALGIPFARGDDKNSELYLKQLNDGKIPGLIGTENKLGEGSDTRRVDCLIMAQFTASKGPVIQAVGRGLRKQGEKTHCYILDYWPTSSKMLSRHAERRVGYYLEITAQVKIIEIGE